MKTIRKDVEGVCGSQLTLHDLKLFHKANKEFHLDFGLRQTPIQLLQQPNLTTIQQNLKTDTPKEAEINKIKLHNVVFIV